jgi:hypothetical protein
MKRHVLNWSKTCTKCGEEKHNEQFATIKKTGKADSWCRQCKADYKKAYRRDGRAIE